ncbi:MAG TPA: hypothetical protein VJ858_06395, partial [Acidimicrobiia bacterium]|nr:hypothetical protein [Acidimicrobiia bacterium]
MMRERTGPIILMFAFGLMLGFLVFLLVGPRDASGGTVAGPDGTQATTGGSGGTDPTTAPGSTVPGESPSTTLPASGQERQPNTIPGFTVGR